jgi:hypothetical protein
MGEVEIMREIEEHVARVLESLSPSQKATLKALLFAGFRGERESLLLELLATMGEEEISPSELTETFTYSFEDEAVQYHRIKPEFYRAVRKRLLEG